MAMVVPAEMSMLPLSPSTDPVSLPGKASCPAPFSSMRPPTVTEPFELMSTSPPEPPSKSSFEPLPMKLPAMLMLPPAVALKKPPSPMPEAPRSIVACDVVVMFVPAVRFSSQLLQSPPLAAIFAAIEMEPRVASMVSVPPPPCALPNDSNPRLGSPPIETLPVSDLSVIGPPKPSTLAAFAISVPLQVRLPTECRLIEPPPKFPLTSIFDRLVPAVCRSMKPVASSVTLVLPSVPVAMNRAPGWKVMLAARILSSPAPVMVICLLPTLSERGRMS